MEAVAFVIVSEEATEVGIRLRVEREIEHCVVGAVGVMCCSLYGGLCLVAFLSGRM